MQFTSWMGFPQEVVALSQVTQIKCLSKVKTFLLWQLNCALNQHTQGQTRSFPNSQNKLAFYKSSLSTLCPLIPSHLKAAFAMLNPFFSLNVFNTTWFLSLVAWNPFSLPLSPSQEP